jgi:maltose O-acetyltransferase
LTIYKFLQGEPTPYPTFYGRLGLFINKIPFVRNTLMFKRWFGKMFNIPLSSSWHKSFYCSSHLIDVGENVGLADTYILAFAPIKIGTNTSFSYRNMLITSTHDVNEFSTVIAKPIIIGDNCWITTNVTILPGVTIGNNTIIGAGSVVVENIPANVFAAGNPCKVIRTIAFNK